jgi:L-aminopeptidase/D-esterase-like protein
MRLTLFLLAVVSLHAQTRPRARDLGVPFEGTPGPLNAVTDVKGVEVGHATLISGGPKAAARTGVTVVWPRGRANPEAVFGGWFSLNGNGEMTGTTWLEESGFVESPVMITNTHSVGVVRDAFIAWNVARAKKESAGGLNAWGLPIVAETYDGFLNDINAFHVKPEHVATALETAKGGPVLEGNVGGGTGMVCYGFKGGIGTSSRIAGRYTVGALVQCNCGRRNQLQISGVPVGREIADLLPFSGKTAASLVPGVHQDLGSIIIVVATDAPLLPHQLKRLARRASLGLARTGSTSGNGSGDIFIAFSTANTGAAANKGPVNLAMVPNDEMNPIFNATVEAVEESIVNAMVGADTMEGLEGHKVWALPHDRLKAVLQQYARSPR